MKFILNHFFKMLISLKFQVGGSLKTGPLQALHLLDKGFSEQNFIIVIFNFGTINYKNK